MNVGKRKIMAKYPCFDHKNTSNGAQLDKEDIKALIKLSIFLSLILVGFLGILFLIILLDG